MDGDAWFERIKQQASVGELYALLAAMPKGGDVHLHLSGAATAQQWHARACDQPGAFWTRTAPCEHHPPSGPATSRWAGLAALPACCRRGWVPLESLTRGQWREWAARVSLDDPGPDATGFFGVTSELKHLRKDPGLIAGVLWAVLHQAAANGVGYLEVQTGPFGYRDRSGRDVAVAQMVRRYRDVLATATRETGVAVRLLVNVSRTAPDVRDRLHASFALAHRFPDVWVGVQLSGREDHAVAELGKLRSVYGSLRHRFPGVGVAVHAGEGFGEHYRVAGAVAVGARRIGHGLNLAWEPHTVERLREGGVALEVSMISNQMLGHVRDPATHPGVELLRRGMAVCLATDNPGVWGAQLTDEFYVAATAWDCSFRELAAMARTSLECSFAPPALRRLLVRRHAQALEEFERRLLAPGWRGRLPVAAVSDYARRHLGISAG